MTRIYIADTIADLKKQVRVLIHPLASLLVFRLAVGSCMNNE
jgi:hypothetical protein